MNDSTSHMLTTGRNAALGLKLFLRLLVHGINTFYADYFIGHKL